MYYAALAKLPGFVETASERLLRWYVVIPAVVLMLVSLGAENGALVWVKRGAVVFVFLLFSLWIIRRFLRKLEKIEREREVQAGVSTTVEDNG
jgi:hypothetical protein